VKETELRENTKLDEKNWAVNGARDRAKKERAARASTWRGSRSCYITRLKSERGRQRRQGLMSDIKPTVTTRLRVNARYFKVGKRASFVALGKTTAVVRSWWKFQGHGSSDKRDFLLFFLVKCHLLLGQLIVYSFVIHCTLPSLPPCLSDIIPLRSSAYVSSLGLVLRLVVSNTPIILIPPLIWSVLISICIVHIQWHG
jgi:hypothetical protein